MSWRARSFLAAAAVTGLSLGGVALAAAASASPSLPVISDSSLQADTPFITYALGFSTESITYSGSNATVTVELTGDHANASVSPVSGTMGGGTYSASITGGDLVVDLSGGGTGTLPLTVSDNVGLHNIVVKGVVTITGNSSGGGSVTVSTDTNTLTAPPSTVYPDVQFSGKDVCTTATSSGGGALGTPTTVTCTGAGVNSWSPTDLPGSLGFSSSVSGLLVPGGSGCDSDSCTYDWATVSGADVTGASASETFNLTVLTIKTAPPVVQGPEGDYVNGFGNGFDVYQQNYTSNGLVVGWTATKADPATHFVQETNNHGGFSLEAVNAKGIATGLCVSDPIGSEPAGFITGQLTLRGCNGSVFQGFNQTGPNTQLNSDTGAGHVEPNGTGAPLVVTTAFDGWGGYKYTWLDVRHLA